MKNSWYSKCICRAELRNSIHGLTPDTLIEYISIGDDSQNSKDSDERKEWNQRGREGSQTNAKLSAPRAR